MATTLVIEKCTHKYRYKQRCRTLCTRR